MKRKILIGVIAVIAIAAAFSMIPLTTGAAIVIWIYLVWMVRIKNTQIFHNQMEAKSAERRLKWLKVSLLVAAISFVGGIVGVVVHNALYGVTEVEDPVTFFIALSALWLFILATSGGLVIFLKGRRETTKNA